MEKTRKLKVKVGDSLVIGEPGHIVVQTMCNTHTDDIEGTLSQCRRISEAGAELIILAGFLSILSADFTRRWPERIINIHPALIPSFCGKGFYGLKVHEAALACGVKVTGATVHFVNEIPDGGRILLQKAVEVKEGDTPEILQRRVMEEAEWILLPQAAELVAKQINEEKKGAEDD